ncbi:hypothetical protein EAI52_27305 [Escherichia coli]|uniref:hypothetical protein n=3 Tax=Escherichia coli TaxID=562 RepID=UPI000EF92DC8|nr:hypothetical protein [Escherichia coli]RLX67873.1 hypothetical protein EAI52_27305 [Escherichia coli]
MQITEALISEPGDIRRFIQQAVDHWPHLLAFYFTLHSAEGNINGQQIHAFCTSFYRQVHERITERNHTASPYGQQIHAFCTSFYRQVHERITERNHTASPSSPVVLRWLREQHGGATIRCLLLFSQELFCHPRASVTVDEECSQVVDLLQQSWQVISAGGQCRVEKRFQVARGDTSGQYVALKTVALSLGLPVVTAIIYRPVQRCTLITAQ